MDECNGFFFSSLFAYKWHAQAGEQASRIGAIDGCMHACIDMHWMHGLLHDTAFCLDWTDDFSRRKESFLSQLSPFLGAIEGNDPGGGYGLISSSAW